MDEPQFKAPLTLTSDQIAGAPEAVRQWLREQAECAGQREREFVFDHNGVAVSGDGLAICDSLEVKQILNRLRDDFLSCQILFELGCEYYNPVTGEHRRHVIRFNDFLRHTDARSVGDVERGLAAINAALRSLRETPDATIYRADLKGGFIVDERTQRAIYRMWRRLARLTAPRHAPEAARKAVA